MESDQPYFSICIPNYNYGTYIGETIQSVLNQTYPNFEVIVVDNASTDHSWEVIQSYTEKDSRVKAYRNEYNVGFAPNLDKAALKATKEYIIMLSSDDTMQPNALERYAGILSFNQINTKNLLLCSATNVIDSSGKISGAYFKDHYHHIPDRGLYKHLHHDHHITDYNGTDIFKAIYPKFSVPGPFNSTLYSKTLYEKVGGYSSINLVGPDGHFANKCLLEGAELIFINIPLFNYRVHNSGQLGNINKTQTINVLIDRYIFSNSYTDAQLKKTGSERKDYIKATLNVDCMNNAFRELGKGNYSYAWRHWHFAFAAYPSHAFRNIKVYLFFIAGITWPIGMWLVMAAFLIKRKKTVN